MPARSDMDRCHFTVSSFPPAVAQQQASLCVLFMLKIFRVINFRGFHYPRKFFNNETFPDYGI